MPKVVRFHEIGGPEKLRIEDTPSQQPGPGEVKLRVEAVGLNRGEIMFMGGFYLEEPKPPARVGYEAAGTVEAVGADVDPSWKGKKVATIPGFSMNRYGVLGEEAIVPARVLGEYPDKLSFIEAAAVWMQYVTAYGALVKFGEIKSGDLVVIPAASSSVGIAAIQIAKGEGAIAIAATRRSTKSAELKKLGADHVIATEEEDLVARVNQISGGKGARLIFDPVAGPFVEKLAEATSQEGIIFEYGALSMQPTPFPLFTALRKGITVRGYTLLEINSVPERLSAAKRYIYERLQDGRFKPIIAKVFPFQEAAQAYQYMQSGAQIGKIVINVA